MHTTCMPWQKSNTSFKSTGKKRWLMCECVNGYRKYNSASTTPHCPAGFTQTGMSILTWSLLWELMAPGFFFFFTGLGEVSVGEWPLEEWVGLDTFLFWGTSTRSADPGGSGTGHGWEEIKHLWTKCHTKLHNIGTNAIWRDLFSLIQQQNSTQFSWLHTLVFTGLQFF